MPLSMSMLILMLAKPDDDDVLEYQDRVSADDVLEMSGGFVTVYESHNLQLIHQKVADFLLANNEAFHEL